MARNGALAIVLVTLCAVTVCHGHMLTPFNMGDEVPIQCLNPITKEWGASRSCHETDKEMSIKFGVDSFQYCGWSVATREEYDEMVKYINLEQNMNCRVPMSKDQSFFIPFTIPFWGVVEPDHFHVDNHINFVFHVDAGKIIGVAAYPVRDRFQFISIGGRLNIHGPIRWFNRHSYDSLTANFLRDEWWFIPMAIGEVLFTFLCTSMLFSGLYFAYLKPAITKKMLKKD